MGECVVKHEMVIRCVKCGKMSQMEKILYLVRGVSGSGKSTFAETLGTDCYVFSADDYWMVGDEYKFDVDKLPLAHADCQKRVETEMQFGENRIAVANTFTREWEMEFYVALAKKYGYTVFSVIVENRHGGTNSHDVPEDKVQEMRDRFEVRLQNEDCSKQMLWGIQFE